MGSRPRTIPRKAGRPMSNGEKPRTFMGHEAEAAESDPGPGWLRSRFMGLPWPRPGHEAACGRAECPICSTARKEERAADVPEDARRSNRGGPDAVKKNRQTERPSKTTTPSKPKRPSSTSVRYFHIYEGWSYYTLRCEICRQMFGIEPNVANARDLKDFARGAP